MRSVSILNGLLAMIVALDPTVVESSKSLTLKTPCAVATWDFGRLALEQSAPLLEAGKTAVDAVEVGIRTVELDTQDQYYVGVGGFPNALGVMELDAAIMDHHCRYGAVMSIPRITTPISVARSIMEKCPHNILTGEGAFYWAEKMGFHAEEVLTPEARTAWEEWIRTKQQSPSPTSIGNSINSRGIDDDGDDEQHDTIGMICLDQHGHLSAGTSTSGWRFKLPGRVGDSPVIGSGLYCDGEVGAAVATGDGEEIMRTCATCLVVEWMRQGVDVQEACRRAIDRIMRLTPSHPEGMHDTRVVGIVAMDKEGKIGAASSLDEKNPHRGRPFFPVAYWRPSTGHAILEASREGASI
eukprot:gene8866-9778_t